MWAVATTSSYRELLATCTSQQADRGTTRQRRATRMVADNELSRLRSSTRPFEAAVGRHIACLYSRHFLSIRRCLPMSLPRPRSAENKESVFLHRPLVSVAPFWCVRLWRCSRCASPLRAI
jgi:hypothetical protein